ncbi:MAG: glycosyltransferase [Candidatus Thermoplasmatota archaeon]|nr:glycosyltransferase [Candidatus Thermoplasmatota archaeon]
MSEHISFSKNPAEIGILEIRRHIPVLYTFCKICNTPKTKVTVFTTKDLYHRLKTYLKELDQYTFVIKEEKESIRSFLKRVEKYCDEKIDVLFVNTIHETLLDLLCYLRFNPKSKKILVVHHVNAWLRPKLVCNFLHPIRTADTNASTLLIKQFIFPKFDAINVIYHPLRDFIKENTLYEKEVFTLPTSIFEDTYNDFGSKNEEKIKVVLPGLVQKHRKDYSLVFPAFEKLFSKYEGRIGLAIPGLPVGRFGKQVYEKFLEMKNKGYDVEIFKSFVPDDIFNNLIIDCDIILAPIRIKSRADGDIEEIYGKTVGSGVIYNAIQYAKPIIVPKDFVMLPELKTSTLTYSSEKNLGQHISNLVDNPDKMKQLKKEAYKNAQKFSLQNLQEYFLNEVLPQMKT